MNETKISEERESMSKDNFELRKRIVELTDESNKQFQRITKLEKALKAAISTVECDSLGKDGNELPWYKQAKAALATIGETLK